MPADADPVNSAADHLEARFLAVLPRIRTHAKIAFRHVRCPDARDDKVAETVAMAWMWFARLDARGKDPGRFPMAIARFAVQAVNCGRRLCGQERTGDVLSALSPQRYGFAVESMEQMGSAWAVSASFGDRLANNTKTPVFDQVAFRLDWPAFFATLPARDRRLATFLSLGNSASIAAVRFGLTEGRVSQLRREWWRGWQRFQNADPGPAGNWRPCPSNFSSNMDAMGPPTPAHKGSDPNMTVSHLTDTYGRSIADHAERLANTLDTLAARVRDAIAVAVGTTMDGIVQAAVRAALAELLGINPAEPPEPVPRYPRSSSYWDEPDDGWGRDYHDPFDDPFEPPPARPAAREVIDHQPRRWAALILLGARLLTDWLRRRPTRTCWRTLVAASLIAGLALAASLPAGGLARSALSVTALAVGLQTGGGLVGSLIT
jgi:hypothetical protein